MNRPDDVFLIGFAFRNMSQPISEFLDVTPYSPVDLYQRFEKPAASIFREEE
jgi:hypothetical protein